MFPAETLLRILSQEREREIRQALRIRRLTGHDRQLDRPHLLDRADRARR
jgi:hypothetical protein